MTLRSRIVVLFLFAACATSILWPKSTRADELSAVWSSTAIGADAMWNNGANWSIAPDFPNDSDTQSYAVAIDSGLVYLNQDITIDRLTVGVENPTSSAVVEVPAGNIALTVKSAFTAHLGLLTRLATNVNGTLNSLGTTNIPDSLYLWGWHVRFAGQTNWAGTIFAGNSALIDNYAGATISLGDGASVYSYVADSSNPDAGRRMMLNEGTIQAAATEQGIDLDISLNNYGVVNVLSGSLTVRDGGLSDGSISIAPGALLSFQPTRSPNVHNFLFGPNSSTSGGGSITFNSGENFSINGEFNITGTTTVAGGTSVTFNHPITSVASELIVNGQWAALDLGVSSIELEKLTLKLGLITGSGAIEVKGQLEWTDGHMTGAGVTNARSGVLFNGLNSLTMSDTLDRTLNCFGASRVDATAQYLGNLYFLSNAALNIMPGATFNGSGLGILGSDISNQRSGVIRNYGTLVVNDPGLNRGMLVYGTDVLNDGRIEITDASLDVRSTGFFPGFVQDSGEIVLNNGSIGDFLQLNGGSLKGFGFVGTVISAGAIEPFDGDLDFRQSTLTLLPDSTVTCNITVAQQTSSVGRIKNVSNAMLDGTLRLVLDGKPTKKNLPKTLTLTVLSANAVNGRFSNAANGQRLLTADGSGSFVVSYTSGGVVLSQFKAQKFRRRSR